MTIRRGHSGTAARGRVREVARAESVEDLPDDFLLCRRQHPWDQERARWEVDRGRGGRPVRGVEVLACPRCGATKRTPYDLVGLAQDGSATIDYPPGYLLEGQGGGGAARRREVSRERLSRVVAGQRTQRRKAG